MLQVGWRSTHWLGSIKDYHQYLQFNDFGCAYNSSEGLHLLSFTVNEASVEFTKYRQDWLRPRVLAKQH